MAPNPAAVLFDLDGVLADACELHREALSRALAEVDFTISLEEHKAIYNGLPTRRKLQILSEREGLSPALHDQIAHRKQEFTEVLIAEMLRPNWEAQTLLRALLFHYGVRIGVCSNSLCRSIHAMLSATGLLEFVTCSIGNDEGIAAKPAPDLFLEGARRLGVSIGFCAIVEDSPVGLQAARAAGALRVVSVPGPHAVHVGLLPHILTGTL